MGYLLTRPAIALWAFGLLRRLRPIFIAGGLVIVTRHDTVRTVLQRDTDFELGEFARPRMLAGSFVLDVDWRRSHAMQSKTILRAMHAGDPVRIASLSRASCVTTLQRARNQVDVAALARQAAMAVIEDHYGVTPGTAGRDRMAAWLTELASAIVLLPPEATHQRRSVERAADRYRCHVRGLLTPGSAVMTATMGPFVHQDLLTRLVDQARSRHAPRWLDLDWVARMICGLSIFGMATVVRTATDAVDELLKRPAALASAQAAAARAQDDPEPLRRHIYEALRFRPMLPVLARYCPRPTVLAVPERGARVVPAGATVLAPPLAAMHDPAAFPHPGEFRTDPDSRDIGQSLVFGTGIHRCIGQAYAESALIEVVGAVLRLPGLHRLSGRDGRIRYAGGAAARLNVGFGA